MAKTNRLQHECEIGATEEYFTEFKWVLKHWTLLYDSTYRLGVHSPSFKVNGTDECTCTVSLEIANNVPLIVEFSNIVGVLAFKLTYSLNNFETRNNFCSGPLQIRHECPFNASFEKSSFNYIFKGTNSADDTVTITVTIMIIKSVVSSESLNKTDKSLEKSTSQLTQNSHNFLTNILGIFKTMLDTQTLCDVTFVFKDKKFLAHKAVLAAQSKVFKETFFGSSFFGSSSREHSEIHVGTPDSLMFEKFLNYFYTGEVKELEITAQNMIELANEYQVVRLKAMCEDCMIERLSEVNAVRYAVIADNFSCSALKNRAVDLIRIDQKILERALIEGDSSTLTSLKKILSDKRATLQ